MSLLDGRLSEHQKKLTQRRARSVTDKIRESYGMPPTPWKMDGVEHAEIRWSGWVKDPGKTNPEYIKNLTIRHRVFVEPDGRVRSERWADMLKANLPHTRPAHVYDVLEAEKAFSAIQRARPDMAKAEGARVAQLFRQASPYKALVDIAEQSGMEVVGAKAQIRSGLEYQNVPVGGYDRAKAMGLDPTEWGQVKTYASVHNLADTEDALAKGWITRGQARRLKDTPPRFSFVGDDAQFAFAFWDSDGDQVFVIVIRNKKTGRLTMTVEKQPYHSMTKPLLHRTVSKLRDVGESGVRRGLEGRLSGIRPSEIYYTLMKPQHDEHFDAISGKLAVDELYGSKLKASLFEDQAESFRKGVASRAGSTDPTIGLKTNQLLIRQFQRAQADLANLPEAERLLMEQDPVRKMVWFQQRVVEMLERENVDVLEKAGLAAMKSGNVSGYNREEITQFRTSLSQMAIIQMKKMGDMTVEKAYQVLTSLASESFRYGKDPGMFLLERTAGLHLAPDSDFITRPYMPRPFVRHIEAPNSTKMALARYIYANITRPIHNTDKGGRALLNVQTLENVSLPDVPEQVRGFFHRPASVLFNNPVHNISSPVLHPDRPVGMGGGIGVEVATTRVIPTAFAEYGPETASQALRSMSPKEQIVESLADVVEELLVPDPMAYGDDKVRQWGTLGSGLFNPEEIQSNPFGRKEMAIQKIASVLGKPRDEIAARLNSSSDFERTLLALVQEHDIAAYPRAYRAWRRAVERVTQHGVTATVRIDPVTQKAWAQAADESVLGSFVNLLTRTFSNDGEELSKTGLVFAEKIHARTGGQGVFARYYNVDPSAGVARMVAGTGIDAKTAKLLQQELSAGNPVKMRVLIGGVTPTEGEFEHYGGVRIDPQTGREVYVAGNTSKFRDLLGRDTIYITDEGVSKLHESVRGRYGEVVTSDLVGSKTPGFNPETGRAYGAQIDPRDIGSSKILLGSGKTVRKGGANPLGSNLHVRRVGGGEVEVIEAVIPINFLIDQQYTFALIDGMRDPQGNPVPESVKEEMKRRAIEALDNRDFDALAEALNLQDYSVVEGGGVFKDPSGFKAAVVDLDFRVVQSASDRGISELLDEGDLSALESRFGAHRGHTVTALAAALYENDPSRSRQEYHARILRHMADQTAELKESYGLNVLTRDDLQNAIENLRDVQSAVGPDAFNVSVSVANILGSLDAAWVHMNAAAANRSSMFGRQLFSELYKIAGGPGRRTFRL